MSIHVSLSPTTFTSDPITGNHLGANVVFTKDYLDPGGPFDRFLSQLRIDFLRFPGGTVTEEAFAPGTNAAERLFDMARPSGLGADGEARIVTSPAMFDYVTQNNMGLAFTLPTDNYFSDILDPNGNRMPDPFGSYRLIDRVENMISGEYGEIQIDIIQIGNEFWYRDERQTPEEYGRIANDLSINLQRLFDIHRASLDDPDSWIEPRIAVQVAQGWRPQDNQAILSQLTPGLDSNFKCNV